MEPRQVSGKDMQDMIREYIDGGATYYIASNLSSASGSVIEATHEPDGIVCWRERVDAEAYAARQGFMYIYTVVPLNILSAGCDAVDALTVYVCDFYCRACVNVTPLLTTSPHLSADKNGFVVGLHYYGREIGYLDSEGIVITNDEFFNEPSVFGGFNVFYRKLF